MPIVEPLPAFGATNRGGCNFLLFHFKQIELAFDRLAISAALLDLDVRAGPTTVALYPIPDFQIRR
jgi:hypothetical protein